MYTTEDYVTATATHRASPSIHAGVGVTLICLPLTVDSLKPCCTQTLILIRSSIVACCTILTRSRVSTAVKVCSSIVSIMFRPVARIL